MATTVEQANKNAELLLSVMDSLAEIISKTHRKGVDGTHNRIISAYDYAQRDYTLNIVIAGKLLSAEKLKELRTQFVINESDSPVDNLNFYGDTAIFTRTGTNWRMDFSPNGIEKLSLNVL